MLRLRPLSILTDARVMHPRDGQPWQGAAMIEPSVPRHINSMRWSNFGLITIHGERICIVMWELPVKHGKGSAEPGNGKAFRSISTSNWIPNTGLGSEEASQLSGISTSRSMCMTLSGGWHQHLIIKYSFKAATHFQLSGHRCQQMMIAETSKV